MELKHVRNLTNLNLSLMKQYFSFKLCLIMLICLFSQGIKASVPDNESVEFTSKIQKTITGKVRSAAGEPLPGVNVILKGSTIGTLTDITGSYTLTIPDEGTILVFSYIGFNSLEVLLNNRTVVDVTLAEDVKSLEEFVVVGYGTLNKQSIASAISTVKGEEIRERPTAINVVQGLAGRVAGVNIMTNSGKPGGAPAIKIRGTGSINTSTDPLYVIDGIVGADPLIIDPNIVESINILKDASAAAIYGARGANGVVVITTRRGKAGFSDIAFNSSVSFGTLQREVDLLDAAGAAEMFRRQYDYPFRANPTVPRPAPHMPTAANFPRKADLFNPDGSPIYNTNWQREATRLAISHNNSLTISGGKEDLSVLANISYRNNQGIMLNSYDKRLNAFINLGWQVKPWLHVQGSLNTGANEGNNVDLNPLSSTALRKMYEFLPFLPVKYPDGTYSRQGDYPGAENSENPVRLLNEIKNVVGRTYSLANLVATFRLSNDFDFVSSFGAQTSGGYDFYYAGTQLLGVSANQFGQARRSHMNSANWTNENYLNFHKTLDKHFIDATGGVSWYLNKFTSTRAEAHNFFDDYYSYNSLQAGANPRPSASDNFGNQWNSVFSRVNYMYDNRFILGASFRIDGSSRFGANNKYGYFPAFSAGWNISNENFFNSLKGTISQLKLRSSYGVVGNAEIGDFSTLARLTTALTTFGNTPVTGVTLGSLANPDLSWEKSEQFDIGIEIGFKGRVEITADFYNKVNSDLLYFRRLPSTTGFTGVMDNIGDIRNRGVELSIQTSNIATKDVQWNTILNFTRNVNKVLNLNGNIMYPWSGRIMEGRPLNEFFGFQRLGTWSLEEADVAKTYGRLPGDVKFQDTNNNGVKDLADRVILGNGMPKFESNMINTFTYKGLSLLVDLQSMYGLSLAQTTRHLQQNAAVRVNSYSVILNAWTPTNQNTVIPALRTPADPPSPSEVADSYAVEDASFIRVRNIGLNYRLNSALLSRIPFTNASFGVNLENGWLFTRYTGMDPEYTSFGSRLEQGVDVYQYPKPRTLSLSLNLNF
jgi:TonB-dependent starch-binding outer membrane protein SusC